MATYKVIQDVEAEDKLVGPLSLRQFIYAGIAALSGYLGFMVATKGAPFLLPPFLLITFVCGFFAFPWGRDQPTEVWALAKIRFMIKPRRRIWNQTGAKELVTVNAPRVVETHHGDGLSHDEVQSRLNALASTIDSRGWAIKNVNINVASANQPSSLPVASNERLAGPNLLPQPMSIGSDISAADDMLDATASPVGQKFDSLITAAGANHRQQIMAQLNSPVPTPQSQATAAAPPADFWFMNNATPGAVAPGQATFSSDPVVAPGVIPQTPYGPAAEPTAEEEALVAKMRQNSTNNGMGQTYGHVRMVKTPEQLAAEARAAAISRPAPKVTPQDQAAIMNLANNDDLDVATIARQAKEQVSSTGDGEVVINLH